MGTPLFAIHSNTRDGASLDAPVSDNCLQRPTAYYLKAYLDERVAEMERQALEEHLSRARFGFGGSTT